MTPQLQLNPCLLKKLKSQYCRRKLKLLEWGNGMSKEVLPWSRHQLEIAQSSTWEEILLALLILPKTYSSIVFQKKPWKNIDIEDFRTWIGMRKRVWNYFLSWLRLKRCIWRPSEATTSMKKIRQDLCLIQKVHHLVEKVNEGVHRIVHSKNQATISIRETILFKLMQLVPDLKEGLVHFMSLKAW